MRKGVVLSTVCLCAAICVGQEPWKFKWPAIIPAVQDYAYEAENPVALDADLTVEVFCADGSKAANWVAAKMSAWFGGLAFRAKDGQGGGDALPEGDEAYSLAAQYCTALRDVFGTHWRQAGWDTPGVDRYSEFGYFTDQIGTSVHDR